MPQRPPGSCPGGFFGVAAGRLAFTLVEIMVVTVILGALAALAAPRLEEARYRAQVARAITEIKTLEIELYDRLYGTGSLPASLAEIDRATLLDPWGQPYAYTPIVQGRGVGAFRKDRFLVPLNTDFDLYSLGADGLSVGPLSAPQSQDDIVRANDGGFIGLASEY